MKILLEALKWSVIAGTAALALALLRPLLDRRYSARWRCWVWLALAAALLLAPLGALLPEREVLPPPVVIEAPRAEVFVSRETGVTVRPAAARPDGGAAKKQAVLPLEQVLTGVWLAGAAGFAAFHLLGTRRAVRRARRWSRRPGEAVLEVYKAVGREMGLKKTPPLLLSGAVDSPMAVGLLRPCLLLPEEEVEARDLRFILRHELTHYRRRDLWYKLVLLAANALHWYNPLIWFMRREAERDLELTCDDAVVAGRDEGERRAYSEALLAAVHRQKGPGRAVLSTHFYGGAEVMKERFRNILGRRGRKRGGLILALALLLTTAAACAVGVTPAADSPLTEEELAAFSNYFNANAHNGLLRFAYGGFEDLTPYLGILFYDIGEPVTDEAEREAAAELFGGSLMTDCTKMTADGIRTYLEDSFSFSGTMDWPGIAAGLQDRVGPYLEEYDAFYMLHGDTMWDSYTMERGLREADGTVRLYYTANLWQYDGQGELDILWDQPMCVTLVPAGDGWRAAGNSIQ